MIELFQDLVTFYNKLHQLHMQTVIMNDCFLLHSTLWEHYEKLQEIVDTFWEDIIRKSLNKDIPSTMSCLKKATISTEVLLEDDEEIIDDLYKDTEYLLKDIKSKTNSSKDLLVQNIMIWIWDSLTKICADYNRLKCDKDDK